MVALPKTFGSKGFITAVEVTKIWRGSGESNELKYVTPYEVRRGTSPSRKGKLIVSKSKSSRLSWICFSNLLFTEQP